MPSLPASIATKWSYAEPKNLVGAKVRITNRDVESVLDAVLDWGIYRRVYIFSGVHGAPGGIVEVDDDLFFQQDLTLAQLGTPVNNPQSHDPHIFVKRMPFIQAPQPELLTAVRVAAVGASQTVVILAWCYSAEYCVFTA